MRLMGVCLAGVLFFAEIGCAGGLTEGLVEGGGIFCRVLGNYGVYFQCIVLSEL